MSSTSTDNLPVIARSTAIRRGIIVFSTMLSLLLPCGIAWRLRPLMSGGGTDFAGFYTAGAIVRSGHGTRLYDPATQRNVQREIPLRNQENQFVVYPHAPFESLPFALLGFLSYSKAVWTWWGISLALSYVVVLIVRQQASFVGQKLELAVLATGLFYPLVAAQYDGQDSVMILVFCALTFAYYARKKYWTAGFYLALTLCKPPLATPLFLLLAVAAGNRRRFIGGFLTMCFTLLLMSLAAVGWTGVVSYPGFISWFSKTANEQLGVKLMPNLRGLFFSILEPHIAQPTLVRIIQLSSILLIVWLCWFLFKAKIKTREVGLVFSIAITATVLVAYHEYEHDLALMFLPILLVWNYAAQCRAEGEPSRVLGPMVLLLLGAPLLTLLYPQIYTCCILLFFAVLCGHLYNASIARPANAVNAVAGSG